MIEQLKLMKDVARGAGAIQLKHLGHAGKIEYKGVANIVTAVDKECEAFIVSEFHKHFPDYDVLAEEGSGNRSKSEYRWIIDPLDGTVNYAHGFPVFCVSIALERDGHLIAGVIYDPNRDELFSAAIGCGAFMNDSPIGVSKWKAVSESLLATGFAYNLHEGERRDNMDHFSNFVHASQALRRPGSAAIDLAWVACGRLDGFWELFLKPWDMAAGVVLIREAGGMVTSFKGGEFDLYGVEILVSNGNIHREMMEILNR